METTTIVAEFKKRTDEQVKAKVAASDPSVPSFKTTLDFSKLSEEEILQWAKRGIVIMLQSKLDSGSIKVEELKDKTFEVPKPGERARLSEKDKFRRMVADLLKVKVEEVTDEQIRIITARILGTAA